MSMYYTPPAEKPTIDLPGHPQLVIPWPLWGSILGARNALTRMRLDTVNAVGTQVFKQDSLRDEVIWAIKVSEARPGTLDDVEEAQVQILKAALGLPPPMRGDI